MKREIGGNNGGRHACDEATWEGTIRRYYQAGYPLVPVNSSKGPSLTGGDTTKRKFSLEELIAAPNIGMWLGDTYEWTKNKNFEHWHLVVIDYDGDDPSKLLRLANALLRLDINLNTLTVKSGGWNNGWHFYFQTMVGNYTTESVIKKRKIKVEKVNIEVLTKEYVVIPPSHVESTYHVKYPKGAEFNIQEARRVNLDRLAHFTQLFDGIDDLRPLVKQLDLEQAQRKRKKPKPLTQEEVNRLVPPEFRKIHNKEAVPTQRHGYSSEKSYQLPEGVRELVAVRGGWGVPGWEGGVRAVGDTRAFSEFTGIGEECFPGGGGIVFEAQLGVSGWSFQSKCFASFEELEVGGVGGGGCAQIVSAVRGGGDAPDVSGIGCSDAVCAHEAEIGGSSECLPSDCRPSPANVAPNSGSCVCTAEVAGSGLTPTSPDTGSRLVVQSLSDCYHRIDVWLRAVRMASFKLYGCCPGVRWDSHRGVSSNFRCPLHKESKPSARLYRREDGEIVLVDFHQQGKKFYSLQDVVAFVTTASCDDSQLGRSAKWYGLMTERMAVHLGVWTYPALELEAGFPALRKAIGPKISERELLILDIVYERAIYELRCGHGEFLCSKRYLAEKLWERLRQRRRRSGRHPRGGASSSAASAPKLDFFACRCLNLFVAYGILEKGAGKALKTGPGYLLCFVGHRQVPYVLSRYERTVVIGRRVLKAHNCGKRELADVFGDDIAEEIVTRDATD